MNVHLTPELERFVHDKVKTGRYNSASEVVREALRLFEEQGHMRRMRVQEVSRAIQEGWDSLRRGEGVDGEECVLRLGQELDERERTKGAQ